MILNNKKVQLIAFLVFVCAIVSVLAYFAVRKQKGFNEKNAKLLVIMVDGVRYDYIDRDSQLKGFPRVAKRGVKAEYLDPMYPANTYPNWYTMVTGLYNENNGFINNVMYDEQRNDFFLMAPHPNASHAHWWNKAEPIWVTAEKAGKKVSMFNWDGCQVIINDTLPSRCIPYKSISGWDTVNEDTSNALNQILDGFQSNKFSLSLVYYEPVDHAGHDHGPDSVETKKAVQDIDKIILQLLENIDKRGLNDSVNVYIISDHGMSRPTKLISLEDHISYDDVKLALGFGAFTMMQAVDRDAENRIYQAIKNISNLGVVIYKKDEIPEELHIKHNRLTLPLILRALPGYYLLHKNVENKVYPLVNMSGFDLSQRGSHGYLVTEFDQMRAITFAIGPAFKSGYLNIPLKQTDHYQVFCKILGLTPKKHDGSWSRVKDMLL